MEENVAITLGAVAFIGFILKSIILANVEIKSRIAECFAILCIFFIIGNVAEFLGYISYFNSQALGEFFAHIFIVSLYFSIPSILILAFALTESKYFHIVRLSGYGCALCITVIHAFGFVIAGFEFHGWAINSVPGTLRWLSWIYLAVFGIGTFAYLAVQSTSHPEFEIRKRCKINLFAFSPLLLDILAVMLLRIAGYESSAAVGLPLATIAFVWIMLMQTNGNLFWLSLKIKILFTIIRMKNFNKLDNILERIEAVRIEEALKETNNMQKDAAALLGIPPSTLCKKIAKYNIGIDKKQIVTVYP